MITVVCTGCGLEFEDRIGNHVCMPKEPASFGRLGQAPEEHERQRLAGLQPAALPAVRELPPGPTLSDAVIKAAVTAVVREAFRDLHLQLGDLRHEIQTNSELVKMVDVPLEQVANSHERAAVSFENLRVDFDRVSQRVAGFEKVIDTAGLTEAQGRAEARFERLAAAIEKRLSENSENMVKVLHLLERMQARELADTKRRMDTASKRAVRVRRKHA